MADDHITCWSGALLGYPLNDSFPTDHLKGNISEEKNMQLQKGESQKVALEIDKQQSEEKLIVIYCPLCPDVCMILLSAGRDDRSPQTTTMCPLSLGTFS